jgi:hypothetical protein
MGSKVRAQQVDRLTARDVVHDRALPGGPCYARRSITIRVQGPYDIVSILVLVSFVERERLQDQKRQDVRDLYLDVLLDAPVAQCFSRQRNDDVVSRRELRDPLELGGERTWLLLRSMPNSTKSSLTGRYRPV